MCDLPRLYLVTDRACARRGIGSVPAAVEAAVEAGARFVQYRDKDLTDRERLELGRALGGGIDTSSQGSRAPPARRLGEHERSASPPPLGASFDDEETRWLVNGRADLASLLGADGVHLPTSGLPVSSIRELLADPIVGASTHDLQEARAACEAGADFVTLSPVFPTDSKPGYGPPLGLEAFSRIADAIDAPTYALGGITPERASACLEAGAHGVAVMSGIMAADDPGEATARYLEALR